MSVEAEINGMLRSDLKWVGIYGGVSMAIICLGAAVAFEPVISGTPAEESVLGGLTAAHVMKGAGGLIGGISMAPFSRMIPHLMRRSRLLRYRNTMRMLQKDNASKESLQEYENRIRVESKRDNLG